ncbi:unnamed protein product [Nesidiocoris tenuis]|uniref:Uncharacterized protein n=1 Tax=Nesidiocoris tenuis TaxID=355587 RepID=A0A6H5HRH7_9HEMI|nr:unnamed protein product [Nesidiocoris tenuis]
MSFPTLFGHELSTIPSEVCQHCNALNGCARIHHTKVKPLRTSSAIWRILCPDFNDRGKITRCTCTDLCNKERALTLETLETLVLGCGIGPWRETASCATEAALPRVHIRPPERRRNFKKFSIPTRRFASAKEMFGGIQRAQKIQNRFSRTPSNCQKRENAEIALRNSSQTDSKTKFSNFFGKTTLSYGKSSEKHGKNTQKILNPRHHLQN